MSQKIPDLLADPNADGALAIGDGDDAVDDLQGYLLTMLTQREWPYSTREAVDVALLAHFYKRYGLARIVYLTSGMSPAEYVEKKERDRETPRQPGIAAGASYPLHADPNSMPPSGSRSFGFPTRGHGQWVR